MLKSRKIQCSYFINPYKQLCKLVGKQHNLLHFYNFSKYNSYYVNMKKKSPNKLIGKKLKAKMSTLSNDKSNKMSSNYKEIEDAGAAGQSEAAAGSSIAVFSMGSSSQCSSQNLRQRRISKESINNEHVNDFELLRVEEQKRVHFTNLVLNPFNSFFKNYGCFPSNLFRNPLHSQNSLGFLPNYNTSFMYRSTGTTVDKAKDEVVQRDQQNSKEWRTWESTQYGRLFEELEEMDTTCVFSIMTYNVLAQDLLSGHQYLYKYHNPRALAWKERWKNLLFEIKQHNADILCLQEVQFSHLEMYYNQLNSLGYDGIYKQRTGNMRTDGCAIYYKTATFSLINYTTVEYNQPNVYMLDRDNVAIVAKFAPKDNLEKEFVVATTHLLYNPRREDVRLAQTQILLTEVDRMSYKRKNDREFYHLPIIITGDFNFVPNSPAYELITKGLLRYENLTTKSLMFTNHNSTSENLTGKHFLPASLGITDQCQHIELVHQRIKNGVVEDLDYVYLYHSERSGKYNDSKQYDKALFSSGVLSHHFAIKSAFEHRRGNDVEATTFQNKWVSVDYIFYSGVKDKNGLILEDKLNLLSRFIPPTSQQLQGVTIPNMALGSDHFSLVAKFKLNP